MSTASNRISGNNYKKLSPAEKAKYQQVGGDWVLKGENQSTQVPEGTVKMTGEDQGSLFAKDFRQGANFGFNQIQPGSLGRLGESQDIRAAIEGSRSLMGGLTGAEMQAQRDVASQNINLSTEQARRRLAAAQARSGVRGATAGAQQANIIGQGIEAQQGLERDLLLRNREVQRQGIQDLAGLSGQVTQFDLAQAARERFVPLSTGLSFAALGSTERGSMRAAQAAAAAGRGGGKK